MMHLMDAMLCILTETIDQVWMAAQVRPARMHILRICIGDADVVLGSVVSVSRIMTGNWASVSACTTSRRIILELSVIQISGLGIAGKCNTSFSTSLCIKGPDSGCSR